MKQNGSLVNRIAPRPYNLLAFTIVELCAIAAMVCVLGLLLIPVFCNSERNIKDEQCRRHLQQIGEASLTYSQDHNGYFMPDPRTGMPNTWINATDDLSWCFPAPIPNRHTFECPNTKNIVRTNLVYIPFTREFRLKDLLNNAPGGALGMYGHSYEILGEIRGQRMSQQLAETYVLQYHSTLKGTRPGPAAFWLLFDQDDAAINNTWDPEDNHGILGGNVVYCDGHVAWLANERRAEEWRICRDLR